MTDKKMSTPKEDEFVLDDHSFEEEEEFEGMKMMDEEEFELEKPLDEDEVDFESFEENAFQKDEIETPEEKKDTSVLKVLGFTMGGVLLFGVFSIVGWSLFNEVDSQPTSLLSSPILEHRPSLSLATEAAKGDLKEGSILAPQLDEQELSVAVIKTLLNNALNSFDQANQVRTDALAKNILAVQSELSKVSIAIEAISSGSPGDIKELTSKLEAQTVAMSNAQAKLKGLSEKNTWLRSVELEQRKKIKRLQKQEPFKPKASTENFVEFTSTWHLSAISSQLAVFTDKKGSVIQLRQGERFRGIVIEAINPAESFVMTSGGKIYYSAG